MHIHWHEGLFLQPQHFQRLQREMNEQLHQERKLFLNYPAGVVEGQPSLDDLANFRLRYDFLRVLMPTGQEVNFPEEAELPALDLKPVLSGQNAAVTIFLGLPLWQEKRANTVDATREQDVRARLLYRVGEKKFFDENTGDNEKPIQIRKLNARFVTEHEDRSGLDLLPVARVLLGAGEQVGVPKLDPEFIAPCVFLKSSPVLYPMVRELVAQVEASRKELVTRVAQGGFSIDAMHGPQFEQVLRLRTLNRFAGRLPALIEAPNVPPLQWYLELRELLGELAALRPDTDEFTAPPYNHTNLFYAFNHLTQKIRLLLRVKSASFMKVEFRPENGVLQAGLTDEHLTKPNEYFLAIKTRTEYLALVALVEERQIGRFKLLPRSMAGVAVRGMTLKAERMPPVQFPTANDLYYFRVVRSDSPPHVWQKIQQEKTAILRWPQQEASDFQATLYMSLPS